MKQASVDLETGKIVGCEPGSWNWYHEKGHLAFNKTDKGQTYQTQQTFWFVMTVIMVVFALFNKYFRWIALICMLVFMYYFFYEELRCEHYAGKQKRN